MTPSRSSRHRARGRRRRGGRRQRRCGRGGARPRCRDPAGGRGAAAPRRSKRRESSMASRWRVIPGPLRRQPVRLVERDHRGVAVEHAGEELALLGRGEAGARRRPGAGQFRQRRQAHLLPRGQAGAGLGALAIHPDLAGAQQLVDQALRQIGDAAAQPAIEAGVGLRGGRADVRHSCRDSSPPGEGRPADRERRPAALLQQVGNAACRR